MWFSLFTISILCSVSSSFRFASKHYFSNVIVSNRYVSEDSIEKMTDVEKISVPTLKLLTRGPPQKLFVPIVKVSDE